MGFAFEISIQNLIQGLKGAFISSLLSGRIYFPSQCLGVCINTGREGEPSRDFIHLLWFPCSNHMWEWIKKITHKKIFPKYHWWTWYDIWQVSPKVWGTTAWFCLLEGKKKITGSEFWDSFLCYKVTNVSRMFFFVVLAKHDKCFPTEVYRSWDDVLWDDVPLGWLFCCCFPHFSQLGVLLRVTY